MNKPSIYSLEYYVSLGCTNRCVGCSHGAPLKSGLIELETYEHDIECIKRALDVHRFALSGGEPLLHPRIVELIDIARFSNLSKEVMVLTNGSLLEKQPPEFWEKLDVLRLSRYPGQLTEEQLDEFAEAATENGAEFMVLEIFGFYKTIARERRSKESTEAVFHSCPYFNKCSAIYNGRYYPCSQAFFMPELKGMDPFIDSIPLEGIMPQALEGMMNRKDPLASCSYCAYNQMIPWRQTTKDKWIEESTE